MKKHQHHANTPRVKTTTHWDSHGEACSDDDGEDLEEGVGEHCDVKA